MIAPHHASASEIPVPPMRLTDADDLQPGHQADDQPAPQRLDADTA